ncbi:hypothetical protein IVA86_07265 [Bradyrhizobium sp. 146]|uniref:hypothetical protein n=1 Tax=Bradyrhizobium sp. 146 TaxID=2782622 RepID=UPI001FF9EA6E|nr:hypothetical protein [Bradyrhizobium sp. 146]MCK1701230.1 hypothetical protein [Bradyrhizobium sp. 146]
MPLIRYFVFTGGALLALLFLADRYMTAPVSAAAPAEPDRSIVRVHSAQTWPEKIVLDTSVRQISLSKAESVPPTPAPAVADALPRQERPRQAFAMVAQPDATPKQAARTVSNKRSAERHRRRQPSRMAARDQTMFFNEPASAGW